MIKLKQLIRNACFGKTFTPRLLSVALNHSFSGDDTSDDSRVDKYRHLAADDKQLCEIRKILQHFDYECYVSSTDTLPITDYDMRCLIRMDFDTRKNYFNIMFRRVQYKSNRAEERTVNALKSRQKWDSFDGERNGSFDNNGSLIYGLWHNSLFTRISRQSMRVAGYRLRNAALFGQNVVLDVRSDQMSTITARNFAFNLSKLHTFNRLHTLEPFNLHFTNIDYTSDLWRSLCRYLHTDDNKKSLTTYDHYINMTAKSYLDTFPDKLALVYISPEAIKPLVYDPNAVYIIGNNIFGVKYHLTDAINSGIKIRRFPVDENVVWGHGSRHFDLRTSLAILNDVKDGHSWRDALHRNVHQNCFKTAETIQMEDEYRMSMLRKRSRLKERMYKINLQV